MKQVTLERPHDDARDERAPSWLMTFGPAQLAALCARRENRGIAVVLLLAAAFLAYKAAHLVYPDMAFTYPHLGYDGFQWLADGLYYAGHDVEPFHRNPGLPLVAALFYRLDAIEYLPVATAALQLVFFGYLTLLLRRHFGPGVVTLTLLFFFFNFSIHGFFDEIMADGFAVTTQLIAIHHLDLARTRLRQLVFAGFWIGVSFLFQYAIGCLLPLLVYYVAAELWPRRAERRELLKWLALACGVMAAVALPFLLYRFAAFGNPFHSKVIQFPLFGFHFFGMFFYGVNYFAFFGIPAAALALHGLWRSLRDAGLARFMAFGLASYVVFWVFLYQWHDPRFLLYLVPFVAYFFARSLTELRVTALFSPRTASAQQLALAYFLTPFCLLYALHQKDNAYVSSELPLTPQNVLVFSKQKITKWGGNETIDVRGLHLRNITTHVPALHFFGSARARRRAALPGLAAAEELREVAARARAAHGPGYSLRVCGALPTDYFSNMRRVLTLRRDLRACDAPADLTLYAAADAPPAAAKTLYAGKVFRLVGAAGGAAPSP